MVANLLRPLLLELARGMSHAPAHLLAGGLLREQVDEVVGAFGESSGCANANDASGGSGLSCG